MSIKIDRFLISTKGFSDYIDITQKIEDFASSCNIKEGLVSLFVSSSCSSLRIIENEPGLGIDIAKLMEALAPINKIYQHDDMWHDGNAFSHLRAFLLGTTLNLPILDYRLALGANQRIILLDFDNKVSNKEIIISVVN